MNRLFDKLDRIDWFAMSFGGIALICNIISPNSNCWDVINICFIIGALLLGLLYCVFFISLLWNFPRFDWHLVNGHFLRKIWTFVLLMPSMLTIISYVVVDSSKELVYESNLYECNEELTCDVRHKQRNPDEFWATFYHFIDPGNQHMTTTKAGRAWAAVISIFGVFFVNGLLVSSIIGWIDRRKEKWLKGEVKYKRFLKRFPHYVIIGGNDMVKGIVEKLLSEIDNIIIIQTSRDVENFRRELFSTLNKDEQERIIIYFGSRTSEREIKELHIEKAKEVYLLGEDTRTDDIESYHDTMNMECLKLLNQYIKDVEQFKQEGDKDNRLICRVMFEYQTSFNILQTTDVDSNKIKFLPFNYYEMWAQNVLICQELTDENKCLYLPLEGFAGIKSTEDSFVHLIIVGMSRMGIAMAIEAAHLAHYPNFNTKNIRTKITFIDRNASEEMNFFTGRFKELFAVSHWRYGQVEDSLVWKKSYTPLGFDYLGGDFVDIEWEFINGSVEHPAIQQYLSDLTLIHNAKLTIAICLPENSRAIAAAAYLPDDVYKSKNTQQVLVYQRLNDELLMQINNNNKRYYEKLRPFGMAGECYNSSLVKLSEDIAKDVSNQYEQYMWVMMKERYVGDGLIDDDYDYLTGWVYSSCIDSAKVEMRNLCDEWMKNYHQTELFLDIREEKETFVKKYQSKEVGKSKAAKMWSNQYNILSMWTKFRCTLTSDNHVFNPMLNEEFDDIQIRELGRMEHNRWVVEQLLLRYRPLTKEEQQTALINNLYASSAKKNSHKSQYAHLDICSNNILNKIDCNISKLDEELIRILPKSFRKHMPINNIS